MLPKVTAKEGGGLLKINNSETFSGLASILGGQKEGRPNGGRGTPLSFAVILGTGGDRPKQHEYSAVCTLL